MNYSTKYLEVVIVIRRIPNHLCAAFIGWVIVGGHTVKNCNGHVRISKDGEVARIYFDGEIQPDYKMDKVCIKYFENFSRWWLRNGGDKLTALGNESAAMYFAAQKQVIKLGYLGMAA